MFTFESSLYNYTITALRKANLSAMGKLLTLENIFYSNQPNHFREEYSSVTYSVSLT